MHGGVATIYEDVDDNGKPCLRVKAQRLWKVRASATDTDEQAMRKAVNLKIPLEWTSPSLMVIPGADGKEDTYRYEYTVPSTAFLSKSRVRIVGESILQVVEAPENEVTVFEGDFTYRHEQEPKPKDVPSLGDEIFLNKVAGYSTRKQGRVRLTRTSEGPQN